MTTRKLPPNREHDYLLKTDRERESIDIPSRAPFADWLRRTDPFYDATTFDPFPPFAPHGRRITRFDAARGREAVELKPDFITPTARFLRSDKVRSLIAALFQWHQLTTEQLVCHLGIHPGAITRYATGLFKAGVLERAPLQRPDLIVGKSLNVYQLRYGKPLQQWLDNLDASEALAVTSGLTLQKPSSSVRHNLLVAELALRLFEVDDTFNFIVGERNAKASSLLAHASADDALCGDALVLAPNGLRVVIEMTQRQLQGDVERKMRRWARYLAQAPPESSATVVLFVNAAADHAKGATSLRNAHANVLTAEGLREHPGRPATAQHVENARRSLLIANWRDWFPQPGVMHPDLPALTAGAFRGNNQWERVELLFTERPRHRYLPDPDAHPAAEDTLLMANSLYSTPVWASTNSRRYAGFQRYVFETMFKASLLGPPRGQRAPRTMTEILRGDA